MKSNETQKCKYRKFMIEPMPSGNLFEYTQG